jgi:hypothetical protein
MGRTVRSAVVVDGEHALGAARGAAECLLDGVAQHAIAEGRVELAEALRRRVVHGQDEAEVGRMPEAAAVLAERLPDGGLIASHCPVAFADTVELTPPAVGQSLLAMRDVVHL